MKKERNYQMIYVIQIEGRSKGDGGRPTFQEDWIDKAMGFFIKGLESQIKSLKVSSWRLGERRTDDEAINKQVK